MNRVALVIMYSGSEPSAYIKEKISQQLITTGVSDGNSDIDIYFFNEKEVANGIIRNIEDDVINKHFLKEEKTPEELAVIYIGTLFARSIIAGNFSYELLSKCLEVYRNNCVDERLLNAMRIIAKDFSLSRVNEKIQTKYHFGLEQYKTVCSVWEVCQKLKGEL